MERTLTLLHWALLLFFVDQGDAFSVVGSLEALVNLRRSRCLASSAKSDYVATGLEKPVVTKDGILIVKSMPPPLPDLRNQYYLLRHGQSEGNVEGVISSARSLVTSEKHGLTALGYKQGRESAKEFLRLVARENDRNKRVFFYSSPFARARQTARACVDALLNDDENSKKVEELGLNIQSEEIILEDGVMERFFGRLDGDKLETYAYVWPVDIFDVCSIPFEVESVAAVATRVREAITRCDTDQRHADAENGDIIVVASHADILQITQVYAAGADNVGTFSQYRFANGEVRKMKRSIDSLPSPEPMKPPKKGT